MTNSINIPFNIINALNEFESYGLNDNSTDSPEYNEILKSFEQLRESIGNHYDEIIRIRNKYNPPLIARNFTDENILDFKRELSERLNVDFINIGTGHPELSGISFIHTYDSTYKRDNRIPEYTDIFDLIGHFYDILQNDNQLIYDIELASYYLGTGENRDDENIIVR